MYTSRLLLLTDLKTIASFPQNEDELYYMFPKATYPLTPSQLEEGARTRFKPTVIIHNDEVVAYANLYDLDGDYCWLGNVIVSINYRGKGVSQYLIKVMASVAKDELKVRALRLTCHNTNIRGIFFYTKIGFKPFEISRIEKYPGDLVAGIRMEMEL